MRNPTSRDSRPTDDPNHVEFWKEVAGILADQVIGLKRSNAALKAHITRYKNRDADRSSRTSWA